METKTEALVVTSQAFAEVLTLIEKERFFGIDLEFIPERTYYPIICLIQVAVADRVFLIDPLKLKNAELFPLWEMIANPEILKILHAGTQDLTIAFQRSGLIPQNIFDTQIAAGFLGFGYPVGYGKLLSAVANVHLSKTESFTDWQLRPLSQSQIEYAIGDVAHLLELYQQLKNNLVNRGRLAWAEDECQSYSKESFYVKEQGREFLRIKGAQSLSNRKLAVLQALTLFREEEAKRLDKPARTILNDNILLEIARKPPQVVEEIKRIRGIRPDQLSNLGSRLLKVTKDALALPDDQCPSWPQGKAPSKNEVLVADILYTILKLKAQEADLAPELVATRDEVQSLVKMGRELEITAPLEPGKLSLTTGWRHELAGETLWKILGGGDVNLKINLKHASPVILKLD